MAMQEDLAALFSRNLSLHQPPPYVAPQEEPPQVEQPITYSITQHYHHSNHLAAQQPARPASEPPQTDQLTVQIILGRHGVDVNTLFPPQLELFTRADATQQMRLIELWRICPPNAGGHALPQDLWNYPATSLEQEESMAKLRYDQQQMMEERLSRTGGDQNGVDAEDSMSDDTTPMPMTPIQGGDGRWSGTHVAEPYMASGYEELARREYEQSSKPSKDIYSHLGTAVGGPTYSHATDPVYRSIEDIHKFPNVGGDWEQLLHHQQQAMAMENQYGAFVQTFHHQNGGGGGYNGGDEEML